VICPQCGADNPEQARFCWSCGQALAMASRARAAPAEERKVVTVLFSDLVGFTARSDRADPEDVRASLRPYHAMAKQQIERHGGTLDKFIGDGVLGVFGAPSAHEDDPQRAVLAGIRLLEDVRRLRESDPSSQLQIRVGIETGEAVVAVGSGPVIGETVAGDVVNTASRLQGQAPPGGLVVGEATYRATASQFDYEPLEPVTVKGKAEPLALWLAKGARARTGAEEDGEQQAPFVGRDPDLRILEALFTRTVRERSVQSVTIWGEPGIGKSRLLREFRRSLEDRPELIRWRQGRSLAYGDGVSFWALGEIVKAEAGIIETDDRGTAAAKLEAAVEGMPFDPQERPWMVARLGPLVGLGQGQSSSDDGSFAGWRRFIEALAADHPTVVVFEDLHWADPALIRFVDDLAQDTTEGPLLIVTLARPELFERYPEWGGGKRNVTSLALGPLSRDESAAMIGAIAGIPEDVRARIAERADGNPLFAQEFARMVADLGSAQGGQDGRAAELPFPTSLRSLIASRLDTLPVDRKILAQAGSVVGTVFWSGALAAMEDTAEEAVAEGLGDMAARGIVRPSRTSTLAGTREFAFSHALVRDVAYAQMPRLRRAERHRSAAVWIESMAGERLIDLADVLAYHYESAMQLLTAAGSPEEAAGLHEPARRFLTLAGDRAMQLDVRRAYERYRQALDLTPRDEAARGRLLVKTRAAAWQLGRIDEAQQLCEEAIATFRTAGDRVAEADAKAKFASLSWQRGESAKALSLLQEAIATLEAEPPGPELIDAKIGLAFQHIAAAEPALARVQLDGALELIGRLGTEDQRLEALGHRGAARCFMGDLGGLDDLREALDSAKEGGHGTLTGLFANNLGEMVWVTEGPEASLEYADAGIEFTRRIGIHEMTLAMEASFMGARFDLGRWDEVLEIGESVIRTSGEHGSDYWRALAEPHMVNVLARRGEIEVARVMAEAFVPGARDVGDPQLVVAALAWAAVAQLAAGRPDVATELVRDAAERTHDRGARWYRLQYLPDLVRVALGADEVELAASLIDGLEPTVTRHRLALETATAAVDEARGAWPEAEAGYREAAEGWDAYGHVLEAALARMGLARSLRRGGADRTAESGSALREGRERLTELKADALLEELDAIEAG
jgi:class 3 adenylate cyclase/tetratricopeptide (TPR) repeat protein